MSSGHQHGRCERASAHTHTHIHIHMPTQCHTKAVIYLLPCRDLNRGELSHHLICVEKWRIIYVLPAVTEVLKSEWGSRALESYHLRDLHYEYVYYRCLASPGLILCFCAAEKLSGMVGFLSRLLVHTKTCLIFSRMEMFDSWSWTKRICCGLMFHWAREEPQTLSLLLSLLWTLPSGLCVRLGAA